MQHPYHFAGAACAIGSTGRKQNTVMNDKSKQNNFFLSFTIDGTFLLQMIALRLNG